MNECLAEARCSVPVLNLGLPDRYIGQGSHEEQLRECGLDVPGILDAIRGALASRPADGFANGNPV